MLLPLRNWQTSLSLTVVRIGCDQCNGALLITYVLPGSPWGAGTLASADGSRQPSTLELEVAEIQGKSFYAQVSRAFK